MVRWSAVGPHSPADLFDLDLQSAAEGVRVSDTPKPFTIEFAVESTERFDMLRRVFDALKAAKTGDTYNDEDPAWLAYFDDHAKQYFHWTADDTAKPAGETWGPPRWYFWSMVHVIGCGEYDLIGCEMVSADRAEIRFDPHSYPFGGTASLRVLIECFGFTPLRDWDEEPFHTWEEIEEAYRRMGK